MCILRLCIAACDHCTANVAALGGRSKPERLCAFFFFVCVCVGRLKRRKTCIISYHIAGGHWGSIQSVANEDTVYFLCKRTCFSFNC